jgi:Zn finger protein HypA/HybF involved in hydrogenase expression
MNESRTLDGNAIGGLLLELFGVELTAAPCTCGGCGAREEVARLDVYVDCPGIVVRCRHCHAVMITIVKGRERTRVDLSGTRGLEL